MANTSRVYRKLRNAVGRLAAEAIVADTDASTSTDTVQAGQDGRAGYLECYPSTTDKGKLQISCTDQTGDTTVSLVAGAMAAARTVTLRDPGAAASLLTTTDSTAAATSATAAEITAYCAAASRTVVLTDADTPILAANSGKLHMMPNVGADRTYTLPTPAAGLIYEFIATLNAADNFDWIIQSTGTAAYFTGGVTFLDSDAGAGADELSLIVGNGSSNYILQVNLPQPGTTLRFICNGTTWNLDGIVCSTTAPTITG